MFLLPSFAHARALFLLFLSPRSCLAAAYANARGGRRRRADHQELVSLLYSSPRKRCAGGWTTNGHRGLSETGRCMTVASARHCSFSASLLACSCYCTGANGRRGGARGGACELQGPLVLTSDICGGEANAVRSPPRSGSWQSQVLV